MNFLLVLTIVSFLIATVLSMDTYGGGGSHLQCGNICINWRTSNLETLVKIEFFQTNYDTIPSEGDLSDSEGYRKHKRMRMRLRAKRLRMKALKKRKLAKKARKAKKVRRVVKKNKH
ncbi:hypothetical protein Aduo_007340 [Ancylostoma duodenale]